MTSQADNCKIPLMRFCRKLFSMILFFNIFTFTEIAQASISLGCESRDKSLSISYLYLEGDGIWTLLGEFRINHQNKAVKSGLFNWFKWDQNRFQLTVFSWSGRLVHISAEREDLPDGWYKIKSGDVIIDNQEVNISGLEIECLCG